MRGDHYPDEPSTHAIVVLVVTLVATALLVLVDRGCL